MPLVKTGGCCSRGYAGKAKDYLLKNKGKIGLVGGAGAVAAGLGYRSRAKEREREEAIVNNILERNLRKEAAFFTPVMNAIKAGANALGAGAKAGYKSVANSLGKAGYTGAQNAMTNFGQKGMNMARNVAQWGRNAGQRVWGGIKRFGAAGGSVTPMN